ncbi:PREDICTED: UPF0481 protein At3g47200 [Theobroma cacao]|uniref:UPF0481 protein At3g47200 n=1 Tax=Theobroma cacao TaxID=3641 RepID=A0AB32V6G8_THECC|nr:PREDICTED: UPF0481 protein At3g47200 [Theobroma cacao]
MAVATNGKEPSLGEKPVEGMADEKDEICIPMAMLHRKFSRSPDAFIFRVPYQLRQVNERAYEPRVISIGPYHRGKAHLRAMEIHKWSYLKMLLQRRKEDSPVRYVEAMRNEEKAARSCYAETVYMSTQEFVEMLVLDGCFIIELIRKFACDELKDEHDDLFKRNFNLSIVGQELLLVENQLPFFVLDQLFKMTKTENEEEAFNHMALRFFSGIVPGPGIRVGNNRRSVRKKRKCILHLLGLVQANWLPSPEGIKRSEQPVTDRKWNFIRSAKELLDVGIKFKKASGENSLFDIKFEKGRFQIPTLTIYHDSERIFRNFIAYEQFNEGPTYVMDYTRFMDCLINYGDDVALLSHSGIIVNWLGSNEEVAHMFNKLNDFVYLSTSNFYYSELFNDVNKYCRGRWTLWKIKLRNKYFDTPWDWVLTSIIAGAILLLLTLVQTVFAVLSYFKQGN